MTQTFEQLRDSITGGESELLELKETTGQRRDGAKAACAMLNSRGGRIVYGITSSGEINGQEIGVRTIEDVTSELQLIEPPAFPEIENIEISKNRSLLVVTVPQGQSRPYAYRGKAYKRVGSTCLELSRDEYNRMLLERLHGERRWEAETLTHWTVEDLERAEVTRTLDEAIRRGRAEDPGTRDLNEVLRGFGLMRGGEILRAAAILFGKPGRLEQDFPQCLLRAARFRGTDKTEFLDNRQFHGNAFVLLSQAERFLRENLPVAGRILPDLFEREDDPLYPPTALREALANAFCHRDYSIGGGSVALAIYDDRLEVTSSGGLHFGLTPDALFEPHESLPWNPLIARVFFRRGIIESWGRGTLKMAELTERAGLPRPQIEESGGCLTVRFSPSRYLPPQRVGRDLSDRQQVLMQLLHEQRKGLALREMLSALNNPPSWEIKNDLATLKALGLVEPTGHGRGAFWRAIDT
jgi:ATP-dependent DNA helicase RecG